MATKRTKAREAGADKPAAVTSRVVGPPPDKAESGKVWKCATCGSFFANRPPACERCGSTAANYVDKE